MLRRKGEARGGGEGPPHASEANPAAANPSPPREGEGTAAPTKAQTPPAPSSPPPPLPGRAPETSGPRRAPGAPPRCFVCGSSLEAGTCPQCRITWVE